MPNPTTNEIERNIAENNIIKDKRNLFILKKEKDSGIKDKIIREIRILFESDEEDYHEPVRIGNTFSSNYIEHHCDKVVLIRSFFAPNSVQMRENTNQKNSE